MGCEGSRVTAEERAQMQHNLGLDHVPHVHLHPHHGHHHLEGFSPNELAHAGHSSDHLHTGHSSNQLEGHKGDLFIITSLILLHFLTYSYKRWS